MTASVRFRRMEDSPADYGRIVQWLADPEIHRYYEKRALSMAEVAEKFGPRAREEETVVPLILEWDGEPVGYAQYYSADPEEYHAVSFLEEHGCRHPYGIDLFLGERSLLGHGIGTVILSALRDMLLARDDCDSLLIDPEVSNLRAIRCYEKCGFLPVSHYRGEDGEQMSMAFVRKKA
ncbi:MAG: GNAT family N-acetyltransferase [Candidatus Merdivicinus sp.]|jgi:aminoglycoside 6'-N-acetyltransferase